MQKYGMQNIDADCGMGILGSQSKVMVRVMTRVMVGVGARFYFATILVFAQFFCNFYVVCIAQMRNGNGVSIMVRFRGWVRVRVGLRVWVIFLLCINMVPFLVFYAFCINILHLAIPHCTLSLVQCCTLYGNATHIANTRYTLVKNGRIWFALATIR